MTPRQRWPYAAEAARLESIALARKGLRKLEPVLRKEQSVELLREAAAAADAFHKIIVVLVDSRTGKERPASEGQTPAGVNLSPNERL
jgi:hypothetical protein